GVADVAGVAGVDGGDNGLLDVVGVDGVGVGEVIVAVVDGGGVGEVIVAGVDGGGVGVAGVDGGGVSVAGLTCWYISFYIFGCRFNVWVVVVYVFFGDFVDVVVFGVDSAVCICSLGGVVRAYGGCVFVIVVACFDCVDVLVFVVVEIDGGGVYFVVVFEDYGVVGVGVGVVGLVVVFVGVNSLFGAEVVVFDGVLGDFVVFDIDSGIWVGLVVTNVVVVGIDDNGFVVGCVGVVVGFDDNGFVVGCVGVVVGFDSVFVFIIDVAGGVELNRSFEVDLCDGGDGSVVIVIGFVFQVDCGIWVGFGVHKVGNDGSVLFVLVGIYGAGVVVELELMVV
ncbi:hypothetical protein AYI68_g5248, partial [Smittium mucronatum]